MSKLTACPILAAALLLCSAARADVFASSVLTLDQLQILPSSGSLQILPKVSVNVSVEFGDRDCSPANGVCGSLFNSAVDGNAAINGVTNFTGSSASASAPMLAGNLTNNVDIPQTTPLSDCLGLQSPYCFFDAFGSSSAFFEEAFEIVGASTPISVQIIAALSFSQSVSTSGTNESAESDWAFLLTVGNVNVGHVNVMDFGNTLNVGSNDSQSATGSPMRTATITLQPDTIYDLGLEVQDVSSGMIVPEPSSAILISTIMLGMAFVARKRLLIVPLKGR